MQEKDRLGRRIPIYLNLRTARSSIALTSSEPQLIPQPSQIINGLTHAAVRNVPETQSNVVGAIDWPMYARMVFMVPNDKTVAMKTSL